MTVTITPNGQDQTNIALAFSYSTGTPAAIDLQYATRPDFQFCVAPTFTMGTGAATLGGWNRAQTYFLRAREVGSDGSRANWGPTIGVTTAAGDYALPDYGIQISPGFIVVPIRPTGLTLTKGNQVVGYPIGNLLRPSPVAAWRVFSASGGCSFVIETDGSPYDTLALLETNLPEDATVRIAAGPTQAAATGNSPAYTYGPVAFRASAALAGRRGYHSLLRLPAPVAHRFILVDIGGALPPGGLVHITHLVAGFARVGKNYADMTDQPLDLSTLDRQRDGSPDAVFGFRGRKVDFEMAFMTERQHDQIFADLATRVGTSEPVFAVPNSRVGAYLHDRLLYGNLTLNRMSNSNARFTRSLSIESIINP